MQVKGKGFMETFLFMDPEIPPTTAPLAPEPGPAPGPGDQVACHYNDDILDTTVTSTTSNCTSTHSHGRPMSGGLTSQTNQKCYSKQGSGGCSSGGNTQGTSGSHGHTSGAAGHTYPRWATGPSPALRMALASNALAAALNSAGGSADSNTAGGGGGSVAPGGGSVGPGGGGGGGIITEKLLMVGDWAGPGWPVGLHGSIDL